MTRRFDRRTDGAKSHLQCLCDTDHLDFNVADTDRYAHYFEVIDRLGLGHDALKQPFARCVFNVMAVNRYTHLKDVALVCDAYGDWTLAPAFDVIHSHNPPAAWSQRLQMSVNGKFEGVSRSDPLMVAERFRVPASMSVLGEVRDVLNHWPEFADEHGVDEAHVIRIARDLESFALPATEGRPTDWNGATGEARTPARCARVPPS
jgi:serine/threonine-protein kinase HipA